MKPVPGTKTHDARRGPFCGHSSTGESVKDEGVVGASPVVPEIVGVDEMHVRVTDLVPGDRIKVGTLMEQECIAIVDRFDEMNGVAGYHCCKEADKNCCWLASGYIRSVGRYWDVSTKTWLEFV